MCVPGRPAGGVGEEIVTPAQLPPVHARSLAAQRGPTSVCREPRALYIRALARQPGRGLCTRRLALAVKCGTSSPIPGSLRSTPPVTLWNPH